ncbi:MAG: hypothetical protein ACI8P3_004204 [Saprospiraceae bacterium]
MQSNQIINIMESIQSIKIIESMLQESRKSLHNNSFYFILWGMLLIPAGIVEFLFYGDGNFWIVWPIIGILGGIISAIYGRKEDKQSGLQTIGDRITLYTWGAFGITLIIVIAYSMHHNLSPHPLILMLAGSATFISGGISKFNPFIWGGIILELGAILCGFVLAPPYHGLIFACSIFLGYVIPGIMLKKVEYVKS